MQKLTLPIAWLALAVSVIAFVRPPLLEARAAEPDAWKAQRNYPPLVFSSKAWLECSISSMKTGKQTLHTLSGQGFEFTAPMLPIKESQLQVRKPGMMYKFNAFPTGVVPAKFNGLGEGTITEMKTEVEVKVDRYKQPGGPGTTITFNAGDISPDSAYVEFTGVFVRKADKKPFPFRVVFGSVQQGNGTVQPASKAPDTRIMSKAVNLGTRDLAAPVTTALYEAEEDVRVLR